MNKGSHDSGHDTQGTPSYIIVSVLFAVLIFALEGFKESLGRPSDAGLRMTNLAFIAVGLSLCFFWRRIHDSPIKLMSALIFTLGLWSYQFLALGAGLIWHGAGLAAKVQLFHQLGIGTVVLSSVVLMAALLNETKLAASLMLAGLAGLLTTLTSVWSMLQVKRSSGHEVELSAHAPHAAHGAHAEESEEEEAEIKPEHHSTKHSKHAEVEADEEEHASGDEHASADEHLSAEEHAPAEKHGKKALAPSAHEEGSDEEEVVVAKPSKKKEVAAHPSSKSARMKLAAKAAELEEAEESEDTPEQAHPKASKVQSKAKESKEHAPAAAHAVHWDYTGKLGPKYWGRLSPDFELCDSGTQQSPINIPDTWEAKETVKLDYRTSTFEVIDNGHTVQYSVAPGNFATIAGKKYELKQFHFHTPSEHLVSGRSTILEVHFVHATAKGELAVIGVMIKAGAEHAEFAKLWDYMPYKSGVTIKPKGVSFDPRALLPGKLAVYNYPGSLTTPPCSEKVNWNVSRDIITMSQEQINRFRKKYPMDARPVQELGDR